MRQLEIEKWILLDAKNNNKQKNTHTQNDYKWYSVALGWCFIVQINKIDKECGKYWKIYDIWTYSNTAGIMILTNNRKWLPKMGSRNALGETWKKWYWQIFKFQWNFNYRDRRVFFPISKEHFREIIIGIFKINFW